jgi:S1-C subfamily serine protease
MCFKATADLRLIVTIDGTAVQSATQLRNKVGLMPIGQRVKLSVERSVATQEFALEIAPQPEAAATKANGE